MKTMKKALMLLLGTMLVLSFAGAVAAGEWEEIEGYNPTYGATDINDAPTDKEVPVTYNIETLNLYEVTIPSSISLVEYESDATMDKGSQVIVNLYEKFPTTHVVNVSISDKSVSSDDEEWYVTGSSDASNILKYAFKVYDHSAQTQFEGVIIKTNNDAKNILSVGKYDDDDTVIDEYKYYNNIDANDIILSGYLTDVVTVADDYSGSLTFTIEVNAVPSE